MWEADQAAAEQGQGTQVQGKAEAGSMIQEGLQGCRPIFVQFCPNFVTEWGMAERLEK